MAFIIVSLHLKTKTAPEFTCLEDVVNYLLEHPETNAFMDKQEKGGHIMAVMFDEKTEKIAKNKGINMAMPSHELRNRLDSKIVTTQIANEAGVASVPKYIGTC